MGLAKILDKYTGTTIIAPIAIGVKASKMAKSYDCHCGGDDCRDCYDCHCGGDDCRDCYDCHCGANDCRGYCIGPEYYS